MTSNAEGMVTLTHADQDTADSDQAATTTPGTGELTITENSDVGIYEATVGGTTVAGVVYSRAGNRVTLLATSVFPEFRGQGIAGRLLGGVLDMLRARGETATISCPFAAEFVSAHPEYAGVLNPTASGAARRQH